MEIYRKIDVIKNRFFNKYSEKGDNERVYIQREFRKMLGVL